MIQTSIIVPTLNERENIPLLFARLEEVLDRTGWEIIFVDDDSTDGSVEVLMNLARTDNRVRFIRRIGRRGLASACLEGMASSCADVFAVMDCDLQHDETILPAMLQAFADDPGLELTVGSRYAGQGSGTGTWSAGRVFLSRCATWLGKSIPQTQLSDPLSGFFAIRRNVFEETARQVTGKGFKILLDIVLSAGRPLRVREFPYEFRTRQYGETKLDVIVALEYLFLLADKAFGRIVPVRFIFYVLTGFTGVLLHLTILGGLYKVAGIAFGVAQFTATAIAMISNFLVNNLVTFRQQRLTGALLLPGLVTYMLICGIGAVVNIQASRYLFNEGIPWWFAGTAGAVVGAVWNYAVSTQLVWTWLAGSLRRELKRSDSVP